MALSDTYAANNYVWTGPTGVRGINSSTRLYLDPSDVAVFMGRRWAILDNILRQQMNKVPTYEMAPQVLSQEEDSLKVTLTQTTQSTSGSKYDILVMYNYDAKRLHVGDELTNMSLFCDGDGSNYSATKSTALAAGYQPERMRVTAVQLGGYDADEAKVTVVRGNGAGPATPTTVSTSHVIMRGGMSMPINWSLPESHQIEPGTSGNYNQVYSITASEADIHAAMKTIGKLTLEQVTQIKMADLLRRIEFDHIWGRKRYEYVDNDMLYKHGGIFEWIPGASVARDSVSRMIDFGGAYTAAKMRTQLEIIGRYGSESRLVLTGGKGINLLLNYEEGKIFKNADLTARWGNLGANGSVYTWDAGQLQLHFMAHPLFSEYSNSTNDYSMDMLMIDLNAVKIQYLNGMDLQIAYDSPITDKPHAKQNEIFGVLGLWRSPMRECFAYLYGITG